MEPLEAEIVPSFEWRGHTYIGRPNPNKGSSVEVVYTDTSDGRDVCSANISSGTRKCCSKFLLPNGRCKKHGGLTPSGMASPHFKTGIWSKDLPARLYERYEDALADDKLKSLEDDLALVNARIGELYAQLEDGGGGEIFSEIDQAFQSFKQGQRDRDAQVVREATAKLDDAIRRGRGEGAIWKEIYSLREQRRKLLLADAKQQDVLGQYITVTKVNLLITALLDAVRKRVSDRGTLAAISEDFSRIVRAGKDKMLT